MRKSAPRLAGGVYRRPVDLSKQSVTAWFSFLNVGVFLNVLIPIGGGVLLLIHDNSCLEITKND